MKRCFLLLLLAFPVAAGAQPGLNFAPTAGLRAGDLAPRWQLPNLDKTADSSAFLGKKPVILLLDGAAPALSFSPQVIAAAQSAQKRGFALILLSDNPQIGLNYRLPAPFLTLRAPAKALQTLDLPVWLLIDRAGWIREVETLPASNADPQSARLQQRLESARDANAPLEVGKMAPDFSFRDANGNWKRVSALRGRKNLILTFFPKCFTGRCRTHLTSLNASFADFARSDTEIWAVSVDAAGGEGGQLAFARQLGVQFPLLPDEGRQISLLYGAASAPADVAARQSVLIDKNGVVRFIDRQVNPATHGEDLLRKLRELEMAP